MNSSERIGANVVKSTHIKSDGLHAFYSGGQTYTGATGERIVETVTSEVLQWVTHEDGRTTLDACYDGTWLRISEDNGSNWTDWGPRVRFDIGIAEEQLMPAGLSLDTKNNILLRFFRGQKADRSCYGYINQGAYRAHYSVSGDQGATWSDPVQIIDRQKNYNADCWGPGFEYGVRGAILNGSHCIWMEDGSVLAPFTEYERLDGTRPWFFRVVCARGYWKEDRSGFDWEFGNFIEVPVDKARVGCCEPSITALESGALFVTMRCQGNEETGHYTIPYSAVSEDGGMNWSQPEPLTYDDGTNVWTPASCTAFYDSSVTGKTYWIANILDGPRLRADSSISAEYFRIRHGQCVYRKGLGPAHSGQARRRARKREIYQLRVVRRQKNRAADYHAPRAVSPHGVGRHGEAGRLRGGLHSIHGGFGRVDGRRGSGQLSVFSRQQKSQTTISSHEDTKTQRKTNE